MYRQAIELKAALRGVNTRHPEVAEFYRVAGRFYELVSQWNDEFIAVEKQLRAEFFADISGKSLDDQQQEAVISDEVNALVLAGAGSGKTLTITAKVKYLVEVLGVDPKKILLLAFNKKAAAEMTERIQQLGVSTEAYTFHKFGIDAVTRWLGHRPDVADDDFLREYIRKYLGQEIIKNPQAVHDILNFIGLYLANASVEEEYANLGEYIEHNRHHNLETLKTTIEMVGEERGKDYWTLKGYERVKSVQEVMIANYLYLNGIAYEYEASYPHETGDPYRKQYRPDFYLPEYDIYLEHFGVDEQGKAPWLPEVEAEKYLEGMQWKRALHAEHGTTLIETYSHNFKGENFYDKLEAVLAAVGVHPGEADYELMYRRMQRSQGEEKIFAEFMKLLTTFLTLFKSQGEDSVAGFIESFSGRHGARLLFREQLFLRVFEPFFEGYQEALREDGAIDFSDMINLATSIIKQGDGTVSGKGASIDYDYVIIDEYQDMSMARYRLIRSVLDATSAKLFCVGDDWQSIYRFTGADISLSSQFSAYYGFHKLMKIEKTYRYSQELISVAESFILQNPNQLQKQMVSAKSLAQPVLVVRTETEQLDALEASIAHLVADFGDEFELAILGRNTFELDRVINADTLRSKSKWRATFPKHGEAQSNKMLRFSDYPKLTIWFSTVHGAKGLEAQNAIVLNARNHKIGFPNQIADDPILRLVLSGNDAHPYAEERRLFYVALTRTQNRVIILTPDESPSIFATEIEGYLNVLSTQLTEFNSLTELPLCPRCVRGHLLRRRSGERGKEFVACTNYPHCDFSVNDTSILHNPRKCERCGTGFMVRRKGGRDGSVFLGCTNYPHCRQTVNIVR
ncbi:MAG: UvrD-helicase domain-containing protein [Microbacteriaceae bacterium]